MVLPAAKGARGLWLGVREYTVNSDVIIQSTQMVWWSCQLGAGRGGDPCMFGVVSPPSPVKTMYGVASFRVAISRAAAVQSGKNSKK